MVDAVQILRVGPVPDWPEAERFLYVPYAEPATPDRMFTAHDDTAGLDACRSAMPEAEFICDPWMRPSQPDAAVATELSAELRRARADLSLAVQGDARFPPGKQPRYRQLFLANLGPFLVHPTLFALTSGGALRVVVEGDGQPGAAADQVMDVTAIRADETLTFRVDAGSAVAEIVLEEPGDPLGFAEAALQDAYGIETLPFATAPEALSDSAWTSLYRVVALGFATVTGAEKPLVAAQREFTFVTGEHVVVTAYLDLATPDPP